MGRGLVNDELDRLVLSIRKYELREVGLGVASELLGQDVPLALFCVCLMANILYHHIKLLTGSQ